MSINRVFNRELVSVIAIVSLAVMSMSVLQPVLPLYLTQPSIGVSATVLGLMFSVGMVGMVFGESFGGWLADKVGIRVPLGIGTIACVPLVLCFVFTSNVSFIFAIFIAWGTLRAGAFAPVRGYIGSTVPFSQKATFMAVNTAAMSVSRSIGSFLGGYIGDRLGYHADFYFGAGILLLGGALVIFTLRKIPVGRPAIIRPPAAALDKAPVKAPYRSRLFLVQCVIAILCYASVGVISPFLPLAAVEVANLDATAVGVLFTISGLINAALLIPVGRVTDRTSKKYVMITGLVVTAAGMAGIALARSYTMLIASVIADSAGSAIFGPAAVALLSDTVPLHWQSTAMGIYGGCEDLGMVFGSAVGGLVWSSMGSKATFLLVGTTTAALGALVALAMLKNTPPRPEATRPAV
jgi:MFS family permease